MPGRNADPRVARLLRYLVRMGTAFFGLIVVSAAALYFMSADERRRLAGTTAVRLADVVRIVRAGPEAHDPFHALLLERARRLIVTPVLAGISVWIWFGMLFSSVTPDAQKLIAWGANHAPTTTNGEWWRLAAYSFVQGGLFQLLATIAALLSLGIVLERLVGRIAFAAVYLSAGIVTGAVALWTVPATSVTAGATGAILGLYGLLAAVAVYGYLRPPRLPVSPLAMRRLGAGAAVFAISLLFGDGPGMAADVAGLLTGLAAGMLIARGVTQQTPGVLRSAFVAAAAIALVAVAALPLRGTIDARPALSRIADVETTTTSEYAKALVGFTSGRSSAKALVQVIQSRIIPALKADRARIEALHGVPNEQAPLVAAARRYFDLREASWRRRAEGLLGSNVKTLHDADQAERTALAALEELQRITSG